jgi:hypothetical protein
VTSNTKKGIFDGGLAEGAHDYNLAGCPRSPDQLSVVSGEVKNRKVSDERRETRQTRWIRRSSARSPGFRIQDSEFRTSPGARPEEEGQIRQSSIVNRRLSDHPITGLPDYQPSQLAENGGVC